MRLFCVFLIFWFSLLLLPVKGWGQYIVDFEGPGEIKTGYASDTVNLSGLDWDMTEALIGELANDKKNGSRSMRMRRNGTTPGIAEMIENKSNGIGTISFYYARYGTETGQPTLFVEYSLDNGSNWVQAGTEITTFPNDLTLWSVDINQTGNVQIRFRTLVNGTNQRRFNIDDITITDFFEEGVCGFESFDFSDLPGNNTYASGSFIGYGGITWVYGESRDEGDFPIDGKSIMLRNARDSYLEATIPGGVRTFTFDYRKAFTGSEVRQLEFIINGTQVATTQTFGTSSGAEETIYHFSYFINTPEEITIRIKNVGVTTTLRHVVIDNIKWTCYVPCNDPDWYYRTITSGNWSNLDIWEASPDGINNWETSYCLSTQDASSITIQSGHTIEISEDITINQTIIEAGATVNWRAGQLLINNGTGDDLTIHGRFRHNRSSIAPYESEATIRVKAGGVIEIVNNSPPASHYGLATNVIYEHGSVLDWNVNSAFLTSGYTYFNGINDETIPIFRVSGSPTVGADSPTTINGIFEANGNITWQNTGEKRFRNGITGTGNITQTGGKFIINGATAQLGGSGHLILNNNGLEISSPAAELVSDKTITGGPVKLSGKLLGGNELTLSLGGDFIIEDTGEFEHQNSTLVFNGSGLQNFHSTAPVELQNMTMNNNSGLQINRDIKVIENLTMQAGNINMEGNILEIGIDHESTSSLTHTSGQIVNGWLKRWFDSSVNSAEEGFFPVGLETSLNDATVEFTAAPTATGSLMARFYDGLPENYYNGLPFPGDEITFNTIGEHGYWEILTEPEFGMTGGFYRLSLNASSGFVGLDEPEFIRILKRENEDHSWELEGVFESYSDDIFVHSGMSGFSEFVISGNFSQNPLPIELIHFSAEAMGRMVELNWATASEINNDFFTLERTTNMREIEIIGRTPGAGNSNSVLRYSYTDRDPHPGISYYRLKQTDYDGSYEYSEWVAVSVNPDDGNELEILRLFQQDGSVFMLLQTQPRSNLEIRVSDIYGREVHHERMHSASETMRYSFVTNTTGLIFINISDGTKRVSGRLVIQ